MNIELYIAKRILGNKSSHQTTKSITKIAQIGIAAGICVMLLSIFITSGFKNRIIENITQVSADITMQPAAYIGGWSNRGDSISATTLQTLKNAEEVETVYPTINKAVILKGSNELHGAILTGIDSTAPIELYQKSLIEGEIPNLHNNDASSLIAISQNIAKLLNVKVGDNVLAYFISDETRIRRVTISGIISTGIKEIDDSYALCDLRLLQKVNQWNANEFDTYSIRLKPGTNADEFANRIDYLTDNKISGNGWFIRTVYDKHPEIFDWLELLNMNVWVILILLSFVAGFNMISSLLILILERATFVGIMKSVGLSNINMRKIFLWISAGLIGKGMLWGNVTGFIFAIAQYYLHIIKLDPEIYYMEYVPIMFNMTGAILLNVGVLAITLIMMIIPTMIISKIDPIKVIRFE